MKKIPRNVLMLGLLLTPLVCGAEAARSDPPAPVDQVIVKATRDKLAKLEKEVKQAEQRFYQRYNEVNTKRDFAVKCYNEAETGSRFKRQYCQPVFANKAQEEQARRTVQYLGSSSTPASASSAAASMHAGAMVGAPGMGAGTGSQDGGANLPGSSEAVMGEPALMAVAGTQGDFQKNMIEATSKNPELMKLLNKYVELSKEYEDTLRQAFGQQPKKDANEAVVLSATPSPPNPASPQ